VMHFSSDYLIQVGSRSTFAVARSFKSWETLRTDFVCLLEKTYSYVVVSVLAMTKFKFIRMGFNCQIFSSLAIASSCVEAGNLFG
jgi:hypothetical protein